MIDPIKAYADEVVGAPLDPKVEEIVMEARDRAHIHDGQGAEEVARQREQSDGFAKPYRWVGQEELKDSGARRGRLMTHAEFITKLRDSCHLRCWYTQHNQPGKITLRVQIDGEAPQIAAWAQYGWMTEYSIMRFDDHNVPEGEKFRGWRTVLLQLVLKGYLSEELANQAFGHATGPASGRYLSMLYNIRNRSRKG